MKIELPDIPPIKDHDLAQNVKALVRAAVSTRATYLRVAKGEPVNQILEDYEDAILLADIVIERWRDFLKAPP